MTILLSDSIEFLANFDEQLTQQRYQIMEDEKKVFAARLYHFLTNNYPENAIITIDFHLGFNYSEKSMRGFVNGENDDDITDFLTAIFKEHIWDNIGQKEIVFPCNKEGLSDMIQFILQDENLHSLWMIENFEHELQKKLPFKAEGSKKIKI
jgi:hypothetical protein